MAPIELTRATYQVSKTTAWPTFAPFQQELVCLRSADCGSEFDCIGGVCVPRVG